MSNLARWDVFRWDPFKKLVAIGERFNRVSGQLPVRHEIGPEALTVADWIPAVEITEDEEEYLIKAEFPEVDMKDVDVKIQEGILTAQGVRKMETEKKNKRFHRIARSCATFVRSCVLPDDAAEDRMTAEFKDGLLLVHLPKTERTRARPLEVNVE